MRVAKPLPSQAAVTSKPGRRRSPYRRPPGRPPTHGAAMLSRILHTIRLDAIDQRSQAGVYLRRVRQELLDQLADATTAERLLVDEAAKASLITRAVGEHIMSRDTLVRDAGDLLPVVMQHATLQANLMKMLLALGLRRREMTVPSLSEYITEREREKASAATSPPLEGRPRRREPRESRAAGKGKASL